MPPANTVVQELVEVLKNLEEGEGMPAALGSLFTRRGAAAKQDRENGDADEEDAVAGLVVADATDAGILTTEERPLGCLLTRRDTE